MHKSIVHTVAALALIGCHAAHAADTLMDVVAYRGADLRALCNNPADQGTIKTCNGLIGVLIQEVVGRIGMSNTNWTIPNSAKLEDLEKNVRNFLPGAPHKDLDEDDLDQGDARVIVMIVLWCRYPSAATKNMHDLDLVSAKECSTIYGKKGN